MSLLTSQLRTLIAMEEYDPLQVMSPNEQGTVASGFVPPDGLLLPGETPDQALDRLLLSTAIRRTQDARSIDDVTTEFQQLRSDGPMQVNMALQDRHVVEETPFYDAVPQTQGPMTSAS